MESFKDVSVIRKANVYFDGGVSSRTIVFGDGSRKTLGFMVAGEYEFGTSEHEIIELLQGEMEVLLPGSEEWLKVTAGGTFEVEAGKRFGVRVSTMADYCCSYG
jgi:uncharacterized protein YaiE (UPF0345 family)